jgi:hypothetical protein
MLWSFVCVHRSIMYGSRCWAVCVVRLGGWTHVLHTNLSVLLVKSEKFLKIQVPNFSLSIFSS